MRDLRFLIAVASMFSLLAGCLGGDEATGPVPAAGTPALSMRDRLALADAGVTWVGKALQGGDGRWDPGEGRPPRICVLFCIGEPDVTCDDANCERVAFEVLPGDGPRVLEVSIRWPTDYDSWFLLFVEDADGEVVAAGEHSGYASSVGRVALLDDPAPGLYEAVVILYVGESSYEGVVEIESRPSATGVRELLPDLITMTPTDIQIETPGSGGVGVFAAAPGDVRRLSERLGAKGCGLEEHLDHGDMRCLRFSNSVGNIGEGPLEIRLPLAATAGEGHFFQRVYSTDGSFRDVDAGAAEFHQYHAHWHNAAANRYAVFAYDEATGERADEVGIGKKAGVCLANVGLVDLGLPFTAQPQWNGTECFAPVADDHEWAMGLASNWYDEYPWVLSDQYVDVTGVPDGTYALCSIVNQDHTILESDPEDNEACAIFRLAGDDVEVISEEPYNKEAPGVVW